MPCTLMLGRASNPSVIPDALNNYTSPIPVPKIEGSIPLRLYGCLSPAPQICAKGAVWQFQFHRFRKGSWSLEVALLRRFRGGYINFILRLPKPFYRNPPLRLARGSKLSILSAA